MKSNRRQFIQTLGTSSAGIAMGAGGMATAPEEALAKSQDGPVLLVGDQPKQPPRPRFSWPQCASPANPSVAHRRAAVLSPPGLVRAEKLDDKTVLGK